LNIYPLQFIDNVLQLDVSPCLDIAADDIFDSDEYDENDEVDRIDLDGHVLDISGLDRSLADEMLRVEGCEGHVCPLLFMVPSSSDKS
jgi:predicted RNA-binding protein